MEEQLRLLKQKLALIRKYRHAVGIMSFDFETIVPDDSREAEADVIDYFSNQLFILQNSDEMKALIAELWQHKDEIADELDRLMVDKLYESYLKTKNITPEFDLKMANTYSKAYNQWLKAKKQGDYGLFRDVLGEVIEVQRQAVDLRENKLPDFYDNCLNDCEKGVLQADLDMFFAELKEGLLDLLARIKQSSHTIRRDFLSRKVPIYRQEALAKYLLRQNGYNFAKGVLSTTEHPFTSDIAQNDARVTTHYYEDKVLSNIFSVIHEGGHAIFMQNEPEEDYAHFINDSITNGMHESVSRFYENVIGRSKAYIHLIYPELQAILGDVFADVSEQELYEAVNIVEPSLVRTEADEVTYGLHVIIRYEMEKLICAGQLPLNEIAERWNRLYREYLGVEVANDSEGVLQDVHWTGGFGYFPSYALGNCYNAMYVRRMRAELPLDELVAKGDFGTINAWMKQNVFANANRLSPKQWLWQLTGETLTPKPFLRYLNDKYSDIYQL